ncbi:phage tail terminator protein [Novosphingobium sp. NPDC080210]|uniref:phage tail terminator protein n=1 Tax=Novosphingobium sp. NPDC080210 TaxID=3390596 RepID=UPI003D07C3AB
MKHLLAMAEIIQAAGIATIGQDLFIGTIPADVVQGVMLRDPLLGAEIDDGMKDFYSIEVSVIVRDPNVGAGYARAEALLAALTKTNWENADIQAAWMRPTSLPVSYPRGDADTLETAFRVRVGFGVK